MTINETMMKYLKDKLGLTYHKEMNDLIDSFAIGKEQDIAKLSKDISAFVKKHGLTKKDEMKLHKELDKEIQFYYERNK